MTATVATTHPTYDKLMPKWTRCSDAVDGQDAIREKREAYLPKLGGEEELDYAARLKRSDFFNATWRTIAGLTGMAFRKPPVCEVPAAIEPMLDDVNLAGKAVDKLARGLVEDMLEYGAFGLLVDYPPMPDNVTAISAQASEAMGQRPLIQYYEIESVYNWRYARIGNRHVLVQVRLKRKRTYRPTNSTTRRRTVGAFSTSTRKASTASASIVSRTRTRPNTNRSGVTFTR